MLGDTFKNTGYYYAVIYHNFDRSCVGKYAGFEFVPPNYTGIDHYIVFMSKCSKKGMACSIMGEVTVNSLTGL